MRIYLVRHGDPDYANDTITPAGHKEAAACAERFAKIGLDRIFVSPLGRARDTCRYTAEKLGIEPTALDWTRELPIEPQDFGTLGSLMVWDTPGELIRAPERMEEPRDFLGNPPFAQDSLVAQMALIEQSSDAFLKSLGYERDGHRYRILKSNPEQIALFCHNGFGLTWLAHLLAIPQPLIWSGFWLSPTSVTTILFDERTPQWAIPRCLCVGDTSHLYEAGLPILPRGIKANFD